MSAIANRYAISRGTTLLKQLYAPGPLNIAFHAALGDLPRAGHDAGARPLPLCELLEHPLVQAHVEDASESGPRAV